MPTLNPASPQSLPNGRFLWFSDTGVPTGSTDGPFSIGDLLMVLGSASVTDTTPLYFRCTTGGFGNVAVWATLAASIHTSASDPSSANDNTQGYAVGSMWFNTTLNREWTCLSAATGAAVWSFSGAAYGSGGYNPVGEVTQAGLSTATFAEEGNVNRQVSGAGVIPGGVGADFVLASFTLPANAFDSAGRGLSITAAGTFAANGNNKRVKLFVGQGSATVGSAVVSGILVADTGVIGSGSLGWEVAAAVFKYGAAASNTQLGLHQQAQYGTTVGGLIAPTTLSMAENSSILICVTGNATTASNDITWNFFETNFMN